VEENKQDEQCPKCEQMKKVLDEVVTRGERFFAICILIAFFALMGLLAWAGLTSDLPPTDNMEMMMP